jgi:ATP-dependent RNA helicase DDX19/DBP5
MSSEAPREEPVVAAPAESAPAGDVGAAQVDGSGPPGNGSALLEIEANVEVKLADLQADPNNPLFSANSFEELKM